MARVLEVRIADAPAGQVIQRAGGTYRFEYDSAYTDDPASIPLSYCMPMTQRVHGTRPIGNWMWGLLPENEVTLNRWAQRYRVSARNPFALLAAIGEDCPGAVQLAAPGFDFAGRGGVQWISASNLAARIRALLRDPGAGRLAEDTGQFSLAGAQSKTALYRTGQRWGVPNGRTPTTHILKPESQQFPGIAANEHFCLELARAAGLPAVRSEVQVYDGIPTLIVERFDRYRDRRDGLIKRIHQEDCCQALGVHPSHKYQAQGGPGVPEIMDLLRFTKAPEADRDRFMQAQVFNCLIGGTDAHAKNYSILYEPGGAFRLTPLYDLISFLPYHRRRSQLTLAMTIGGRKAIDEIGRSHWERTAARCGYDSGRTVAYVRDLTASLPDLAATVRRALHKSGVRHEILDRLVDQIADNAGRLARRT
ncbi:type II toxin-antitoxin system HipA family toxin [Hyphomicrobium sp.]|uniref:type II toxin-antitoxin system HipA family toxin n=1 Tax=Hyphomicrobium sp. TaxID=82 RepID=UPI002FE04B35